MSSEEELELRLRACIDAGHFALATELCARHHGRAIGRLCRVMSSSQADAEELAQETLLTAHRTFTNYRHQGSVKSWLFGIARHTCQKRGEQFTRRERLLATLAPVQALFPVEVPPADQVLAARRQEEATRAALAHIRPSDREALLLRFAAELSYEDVARASGIEVTTVRKRVSRALLRLRALLRAEDEP